MLAHIVYFTLKDPSPSTIDALVRECREYLSGHDGEAFFAVGTLCEELNRPVNDRDFHVALHVVFDSKESQDAYQVAPRHEEFIRRNKENWAKVRVFDSNC